MHLRFQNQKELFEIRLGEYMLNENDGDEQIFNISWIKIHEDFKIQSSENDIAILKLDRPVNFTDSVQPVILPTEVDHSENAGNFMATALGWGSLNSHFGLGTVNKPMEVDVFVWNNTDCENNYANIQAISDTMICAGFDSDGKIGGDVCSVSGKYIL